MGNGNGIRVIEARIRHGGRIMSRHYTNITPEKARIKAQREGHVISVRKVPLWDRMGSIERLDLRELVSDPIAIGSGIGGGKWDGDMLLGDASLEDIVLGKKRKRAEKRDGKRRSRGNGSSPDD